MITTSRADWAERARRLREHAMSVSAADRHASVLAPPEQYLEVGYNYRMTDLQAAVGLVQLDRLDGVVDRAPGDRGRLRQGHQRAAGSAARRGSGLGDDQLPVLLGRGRTRIRLGPGRLADRAGRGRHLGPSRHHGRAPAARLRRSRLGTVSLPVTEHLTDNTLILPLFHQMSESEQARVIDVLRAGSRGRLSREEAADPGRGQRSGARGDRSRCGPGALRHRRCGRRRHGAARDI